MSTFASSAVIRFASLQAKRNNVAASILTAIVAFTSPISVGAVASPDQRTSVVPPIGNGGGADFRYGFDPNLPGLRAPVSDGSSSRDLPSPELTDDWKPVPLVTPAKKGGGAPSDAVILFNGVDLSNWEALTGGPAGWRVEQRELVVVPFSGYIQTKESFGDCQLHVEWKPDPNASPQQKGQDRSNSGIYFQGRYEVQILDSYNNPTYANGQAGAVYKQFAPLVNAAKPPNEWQSYDIIFIAPRFDAAGKLVSQARLTVIQNGILVQYDATLAGMTVFRGEPYYVAHGPAPLALQDHHNAVRFRNMWLRRL